MKNPHSKSFCMAVILFAACIYTLAQKSFNSYDAPNITNHTSVMVSNESQDTYGWVLTERLPMRGESPAPVKDGEVQVDFGVDAIEILLAKPYGKGVSGSNDFKNPQRLHARYSWSVPEVIQPGGLLVIVVKQDVLSNKTGNFGNAFGVGISIQNNWYLRGKTNDGTVVEPWVFGIGWGRPEWAQRDAVVTYERSWLWNEGKAGDKRKVSVSVQGVGTQRFEYTYEWKPASNQEEKNKTNQLPPNQAAPEAGKLPEPKSINPAEKLKFDVDNTESVVGNVKQNTIQFIISKGTFDQKGNLMVEESKSLVPFDSKRANLIGKPLDITIDQESKRLHKPLLVKLKLDKNEIALMKRPVDLWVGYFNGKSWDYFPPLEVNLKEAYMQFETYHFSRYAKAEITKNEQINSFSYKNAVNKWAEKDNNLLTKQATQQMVQQILSKNMGLNNKSLTQDIVEAIMKENDYAKLLVSYNDNKMDEFGTDLAVLAGKKIIEVASNESNAKAILGTVTEHSSKIGAGVKMGLALAEGDYEKAAKELSLEIINTYPVTKVFKAAAEITERQINRWRDQELEAAYEVFIKGANSSIPFWGYQVEPGNFNEVWMQMRGLQTKILDDAIKNYAAAHNVTVNQLEKSTIEKVRQQTKENLQQEFNKRREQESQIKALQAENIKLVKAFDDANLLTENRFGFTDNTTFELRLLRLFRIKEMILKDTKSRLGFSGVDEGNIISAKTVARLIQIWYSENGKEKYRDELIRLGYLKEADGKTAHGEGQKDKTAASAASKENWIVDTDKPNAWRAKSTRKILDKTAQCSESSLNVSISANISSFSGNMTPGEMDKELRSWMSESGWYPEEASIEPITISGFKGKLLTTTLKYKAGFGNPSAGYKYGTAHIGGYAILISDDGSGMLKVGYYAFAGCCWDNKSAEISKKEAMAGKNEAEKVLRSLNISGSKINSPAIRSSIDVKKN